MMDNQLYQSSGATNFHKAVMLSACALSIWAGTGTNQSIPSFSSGSGQYFTSEFHNDSQREALFSDRVLEIKNFFGLNTTDLSRIFHVGRPTIYSWINDQVVPKKDSVKRMNLLYQLLKEVNQHNISNISEIKNQVISSDGTGLVEILEAKKPDIDKLSLLMREIEKLSKSYESNKIEVSHLNKLPKDVRKANLEHLM